ncbi:hypothetical protein ACTFO6_19750, partial [Pelomicrobium sp. G1]
VSHEWAGTAYLMVGLMALAGIIAVVGGAIYILVNVWSVFFGKRIETPDFTRVSARESAAPAPQPVAVLLTGHGSACHIA